MKKIFKKIQLQFWSAIVVAVLIVIATQVFPRYHTLQYLEDDELVTESFKTKEDFNERAQELKADSIKYWLDLN